MLPGKNTDLFNGSMPNLYRQLNNSPGEFYINKCHDILLDDEVVMAYGGELKKGIVSNVLKIFETCLPAYITTKLKKRLFYILVECIQNVERHAIFPNESNPFSILVFKNPKAYIFSICNKIKNTEIEGLKKKLDHVNSLTITELKGLYIETLSEKSLSEKGGAGLGLIEISRKSGSKLNYVFTAVNDTDSFYALTLEIPLSDS